jgi:hypothetical protein
VDAQTAVDRLPKLPSYRARAWALLVAARLARGQVAAALTAAEAAMRLVEPVCVAGSGESAVRWRHAEALEAAGRHDEARQAVATAHARLLARADRIEDAALKKSFLERVSENVSLCAAVAVFRPS